MSGSAERSPGLSRSTEFAKSGATSTALRSSSNTLTSWDPLSEHTSGAHTRADFFGNLRHLLVQRKIELWTSPYSCYSCVCLRSAKRRTATSTSGQATVRRTMWRWPWLLAHLN